MLKRYLFSVFIVLSINAKNEPSFERLKEYLEASVEVCDHGKCDPFDKDDDFAQVEQGLRYDWYKKRIEHLQVKRQYLEERYAILRQAFEDSVKKQQNNCADPCKTCYLVSLKQQIVYWNQMALRQRNILRIIDAEIEYCKKQMKLYR